MRKCRFRPITKRAIAIMVAAAAAFAMAVPADAPAQPVWNGTGWRPAHPNPMSDPNRCNGPHAQCGRSVETMISILLKVSTALAFA